MRHLCLRSILQIGFLAIVGLAANPIALATKPETFSGELELALRAPESAQSSQAKAGPKMFLCLEAHDGQWQRAWAKGVGVFEHYGLVDSAIITDTKLQLKLRLIVEGDFWVKGRWLADYTIELERGTNSTVSGVYSGFYGGQSVAGIVEGRVLPVRLIREGFVPPKPDEHPRVLFRKSDVPGLKEKLKTPLGRAYLQRAKESGDLINLGVLYQLTGGASYADQARQSIQAQFLDQGDGKIPVFGFGSGGFGHDVFRVALAYDLCFDTWPVKFRDRLRVQLEEFTERQQQVLMTSHANFHPCSNYYGPGRGVPAIVAMILWGDPGDLPKPPRDPVARAWPIRPPADFKPGQGVAVENLVPGKTPRHWIWTGPLSFESSRDVLNEIGGYEKARPEIGTIARYAARSGNWFARTNLVFQPLPEDVITEQGVDLEKAIGNPQPSVSVYFTAVRIQSEQTMALMEPRKEMRVWMSGEELKEDSFYRLYPGVHPLMVECRTKTTTGLLAPRLQPVNEDESNELVGLFKLDMDLWKLDQALWQENGMQPRRQFWLDRGWFQNYQHYRWGIGNGGFMAETGGYASISSWYPSVYASMYPNFFGRAVSPHPDVSHLIPRQIMQAFFPAARDTGNKGRLGAEPVVQKLNSAIVLNPEWMACHFPIISDAYKPSALWVWNYLTGVENPDSIPNVLGDADHNQRGKDGLTLAQSFLHYPLDLAPVHPSQGMPKTWRADTFGHDTFRSGWEGKDEFISQVFLKASPIRGWNHPNAGGFQIFGLGHPWTDAQESRNGVRENYPVVLLPHDEINQGSCGRLVQYEAEADGSGNLTIDMNDVYSKPSKGLYDGQLDRHASRVIPSGISGLRAMAFDYSGKCGVPAMVVVVDQIQGGGERLWTWQLPSALFSGSLPSSEPVQIDGNSFTLRYPDASMHATFITPTNPKIEHANESIQIGDPRHGFHGQVNRIKISGGGSFFVIMTFQRDRPPKVNVEGSGLEAKVQVGNRIVRFDESKIVLCE